MIEVQLNGHRCNAYSNDSITTMSAGIPVHFTFSGGWSDLEKTVVFRVGTSQVDVPLNGDTIMLPTDILLHPGQLTVGVYGRNATGDKCIASTITTVGRIQPGTGDMFHA